MHYPILLALLPLCSPLSAAAVLQDGAQLRSSTWLDIDGDGDLDLYVLDAEGFDHVFRNEGDGELTQVTAEVGLSERAPAWSGAWADFDRDGRPDLLRALLGGGVQLLRAGRLFEDRTALLAGVTGGSVTHLEWCDADADGWPDLLVVEPEGALLLRNSAGVSFEPTTSMPIALRSAGLWSTPPAVPTGQAEPAAARPEPARPGTAPTTTPMRARTSSASERSQPSTLGAPGSAVLVPRGAASVGSVAPLQASVPCARSLKDQANGQCLVASSNPALGKLFPLSAELNVSATGNVGVGTTSPSHRLTISETASENVLRLIGPGVLGAGARLNFGDGQIVYLREPYDDVLEIRSGVGTYVGGPLAVGVSPSPFSPLHSFTVEGDSETMRLIGPLNFGSGARLNFGDSDLAYIAEDVDDVLSLYGDDGVGISGDRVDVSSNDGIFLTGDPVLVGPTSASPVNGRLVVHETSSTQPVLRLRGFGTGGGGSLVEFGDSNRVNISEVFEILFLKASNGLASDPIRITQNGGAGVVAGLQVDSGSFTNLPHVLLNQSTTGSYARLRMTVQNSGNFWDVAAGGTANELNVFAFGVGNVATFSRANGGSVGIGTSNPAGFRLAVNGSAAKPGGGSWSVLSDARLKKQVRPLEGSLATLLALRGVSYEYIEPAALGELPGRQTGFLAQEVEAILPEWVEETPDGTKFLTIRGFEARTVEALRELAAEKDAEIAQLSARLDAQEARMVALETGLGRLAGSVRMEGTR